MVYTRVISWFSERESSDPVGDTDNLVEQIDENKRQRRGSPNYGFLRLSSKIKRTPCNTQTENVYLERIRKMGQEEVGQRRRSMHS